MKDLEKLIHILTKFGPKKLPLLDQEDKQSNTLEKQLYKNIKSGKYKDDGEAMADLYGEKEDYFKYRMLKFRLRQKLRYNLFFIKNISIASHNQKKECLNKVFQGKALMQLADYSLAEDFFLKAQKIAIPYEFTEIIIDCLENLNFIYTHQPDCNNFYKTLKELKKYRKIKLLENEAYEIYYTSRVELKLSVASKKKTIATIPSTILKLKSLWKETNSFNIFRYYYFLNHWYLELIGNFQQMIKDIERSKKLLASGKINNFLFDHRLNSYYHIYALLRVKQYEKGLKLASIYINDFNNYSRNWFAFMEFYFLLAMHSQNYKLAQELISRVDENPYYFRLNMRAKENWNLYRAYLSFVVPTRGLVKSLNFQEFLASVPLGSKDKMGHNVSIHILHFLCLLKEKDFDQLYAREDSLRKYSANYLNDPQTKRSYYFFKMLSTTFSCGFDREKCAIKAAPLMEKLKAAPMPGDAHARTEIIPYEKLWGIVLGYMEDKKASSISVLK